MTQRPLLHLALARYYHEKAPLMGLKLLLENRPMDELPYEFLDWWSIERSKIEDDWAWLHSLDIKITHPGEWDYPQSFLNNLERPPLFLTYWGNPTWTEQPLLAVVGGRKITALSKDWIQSELRNFLGRSNVAIVSGGARGVDQEAHLCALRSQKPTYVFLPSGLNEIYPKDLRAWKDSILQGRGAILSEYWPSEQIKKHYFVARNRLIASMAHAVLVVQGEKRSGTLLTAKWAMEMGCPLGVVPGHPRDTAFSGNLGLLRDGVVPIIDEIDIFNLLR